MAPGGARFDAVGGTRPGADPNKMPGGRGWKEGKDLAEVTCFVSAVALGVATRQRLNKPSLMQKCMRKGHFANMCQFEAVPGDRGGLSRRRRDGD